VNKWLKNHTGRIVTVFHISKTFCRALLMLAAVQITVSGQSFGISPLNSNIIQNHLYLSSATTAKQPVPKQITFVQTDENIARKD
jgi:hypothetical protein